VNAVGNMIHPNTVLVNVPLPGENDGGPNDDFKNGGDLGFDCNAVEEDDSGRISPKSKNLVKGLVRAQRKKSMHQPISEPEDSWFEEPKQGPPASPMINPNTASVPLPGENDGGPHD